MAHERKIDKEARIPEQCARGRFTRFTWQKPISWGLDRSTAVSGYAVADIVDGETALFPIGIAPCDCKVVRIFCNASIWPNTDTGGAATIEVLKAVIGGDDVSLQSAALDVEGFTQTAETAVDASLSTVAGALDLVEGQLVYASAALAATSTCISRSFVVCVEWVPTDKSYAGS